MAEYPVFLFDIDGVLVAPFGYRAAVLATLRYFFEQMRFPDSLLPDENILSGFEAIQITSEWDMVPISLAAVIDHWLALNPNTVLPEGLPAAIQRIGQVAKNSNIAASVDYKRLLHLLKDHLQMGVYPADIIRRLSQAGAAGSLFPHLTGHGLLEDLLGHTRDINRSLTTRIFQHFSLGSTIYQACYQLPAIFQTESLLASLDRPQISDDLSQQIIHMRDLGEIFPAAFTLRPSLPPRGLNGSDPRKFVPEAEIALELVHLSAIPLIGYGRIMYLADQYGIEPETLLKPSPVQAIAAILAAISQDEDWALNLAYNAYAKSNALPGNIFQPGDHLKLHVFEDSAGGIKAVQQAASFFIALGIPTQLQAYGIASHPDKIAALERVGATLYPSMEQAVRQALQGIMFGGMAASYPGRQN